MTSQGGGKGGTTIEFLESNFLNKKFVVFGRQL